MATKEPAGRKHDSGDADGVRIVAGDTAAHRRTVLLQLVALLFVGGCIGYAIMPAAPAPDAKPARPKNLAGSDADAGNPAQTANAAAGPAAAPASAANGAAAATAGGLSKRSLTPRRMASKKPNPNPPDQDDDAVIKLAPGEKMREVTAEEYIQALHDAGIYEGIGAFNPPGTSPPLEGLEVPDDYRLPDGYVRHFQSTDDGQSIRPILMYSPDYEFFDANGNPVQIPEDRVVREEDAPPGFPIRPVVIPPKREPGDLGR